MTKPLDLIIETLSDLKDETTTIRERMTTDGYFVEIRFAKELPESPIKIVGEKPPKAAIDRAGRVLEDAPFFGVTGDFLKGAEWAISLMGEGTYPKYAVFSDYCDAGQAIYDNYEDALADYAERIMNEARNGVDAYICEVIDEYKA
ncbi:hypothetical protein LG208_05835 [Bacillus paralicheniformis]|uniref:hypothetical protein n=1 Tax=Bacillus paralicheniformis TaxID=1648923 RepID=UPI00227A7DFC|nr:hypothetical protein [Bacillus paralicheniformis]MCY1629413.1 hypothetical protein [Bacillus paralicheniformis]